MSEVFLCYFFFVCSLLISHLSLFYSLKSLRSAEVKGLFCVYMYHNNFYVMSFSSCTRKFPFLTYPYNILYIHHPKKSLFPKTIKKFVSSLPRLLCLSLRLNSYKKSFYLSSLRLRVPIL